MSSNEAFQFELKYWVDDKKKRVIVAEADGDLIDVLFSFLTLPLGTIIRLLNTLQQQEGHENTSQQQEGTCCINKLCQNFKGIFGLCNTSKQQERPDNSSEQQQKRDNTSEQQEGHDNISQQQQRQDNTSEQQEGRDNSSEQREGHDYEQQEGRDNTSLQQEGRDNTSEQQQRQDNISEQHEGRENGSGQQVGLANNSEQQAGTGCINKLCLKDMFGLRNTSEQQEGRDNSSEQRKGQQQEGRDNTSLQQEGRDNTSEQQQVKLGCINELYKSVNTLKPDDFRNKICQKMLHSPRNPLESSCQRLKVKLDDSEPTKYFMCHNCSKKGSNLLVSSFYDVKCDCGSLMRKEIELLEEAAADDGVFVKGKAKFLIYDNLTVRRSSPSEFIKPLLKPRHKNLAKREEILDREKILHILKQALISETPLSDVLLKNTSKRSVSFSRVIGPSDYKGYLEIKVMVSKSDNKIKFVEADGDFVDFVASFLTTPLGFILNLKNKKLSCYPIPLLASILKFRNGRLSLGSIRNLYKSVKNLDPSWFIESSNKSLLNPKVAPYFGCERNPLLKPKQDDTAKYWYGLGEMKNENGRVICEKRMISKKHDMLQQPKDIKMLDPRSSDRKKRDGVGFMKRPCLFLVWDNLKLSPLTTTSLDSYNLLSTVSDNLPSTGSDNLPSPDLEEHLLKITKSKAINLLRASLTSDEGAFTRSLSCLLLKWRLQRRLIPYWGWWRNKRNKKREKRKRRKSEKDIELNDKKEKEKQEKRKKEETKSAAETKRKKEEINNNSVQKTKEEIKT